MNRPSAYETVRILAVLLAAAALVACDEDISTPVVGDDQGALNVDGADFVEEAQLFVHACEPAGTGAGAVGDQVADFTFTNCYGEPVSLHDYCGRRKAMWIVGAAGWCGSCIAHFPDVVSTTRARRHEGLETYVFVGQTEQYAAVDQQWCEGFADRHGIDPATMIFEPGNPDGLQSLWAFMRPVGNQIGLPWEAVLDPYDMTYYWDSTTGGADPYTPIDELLAE